MNYKIVLALCCHFIAIRAFSNLNPIEYRVIISDSNGYSLQVETTYLYDSVYLNKGWAFDRNISVLSQRLIFCKGDSVLKQMTHNVKKQIFTRHGQKYSFLENIIRGICIIYGKNEILYMIEGSGGCNTCSEYGALFSSSGQRLWYKYYSITDKFQYHHGKYYEVLESIGAYKVGEPKRKLIGIWVFPPQYKGDAYEMEIR
jgi:hypothetical protein